MSRVASPEVKKSSRPVAALARIWCRLPVALRAVIVGCLVLEVGGLLTGPLIYANLKLQPAVPWSAPILAGYLWLFWQCLRGRGWPRSTAEARRLGLRAHPLSRRVWLRALTAGYLLMACTFALHWVVGRLAPLRYVVPEVLQPFPFATLLSLVLVLSAASGIVEEAAFRGFMQGPIERRHGAAPAILIVSLVFGLGHLTDWQPGMTAARMFFILTASIAYGILTHMVDSILPGVVLHATGDAIGIGWIGWLSRRPATGTTEPSLAAAMANPRFFVAGALSIVFGVAALFAFRSLARVLRSERAALT